MLTLIQFSIHALLAESDVEKVPADVFYSAFLSTLSLRRATWQRGSRITYVEFSIHALLAESDAGKHVQPPRPQVFYPRSPCGERPTMTALYRPQVFFYPRSPCGERLVMMEEENMILDFSIHALLAESDRFVTAFRGSVDSFLSTLSLRRATFSVAFVFGFGAFSIHALLAESDL